MRFVVFCVVCFFVKPVVISQEKELNFPDDFFGKYKGELRINNSRGKQNFPMEFHLLPTDTIGKYNYTIVYGTGEEKQVRNYFLITKDAEKGQYLVDEDNGIILLDKLFENTLYSIFEVNENLLTTFISFKEDRVIWEITFAPKNEKQISYATADSTAVISYPVKTRQKAILMKQ